MKTVIKILHDFIEDFRLESNDVISFDAGIEFSCGHFYKKIDSEIHVITIQSNGLSALYLLNPEIAKYHIPDYLPYKAADFTYSKNEFLEIKRSSNVYLFYTLRIFPLQRKQHSSVLKYLYAS